MTLQDRLAAALADRYRLERELGAGGMATVFLAEDLKHDRKVAIKVLKPELAAVLGAERFVQEIKTTAALQHPHILPLFDSGEAGGFLFYVMPYIQGETIRDALNRETQFGIEEAVRITREVADALDYAHRHGVIHRDIKPENLLLHDGRAMVMDFGIALAVSAAAGGRMTETGLSLGTPHYMSPEQATADKAITGRSDVYSLATVLYEMLTGNPPHLGSSAQQIIMKIITETAAPVTSVRKSVPRNVAAALARALEKLPADRFESAKAFREALGNDTFGYATSAATATTGATSAAPARSASRGALVALAAVALIAVVAAAAGWLRTTPAPPFRRVDLAFGGLEPTDAADVSVSPDGSMLAVSGNRAGVIGIFVRRLDGDAEFRFVEGTSEGLYPCFSPDNEWIVFRNAKDRSLVKVRVAGGGAVTLIPASTIDAFHPHWGADGRIVFSGPQGQGIVSENGGTVTRLPKVVGRRPYLLPDGSGVLSSDAGRVRLYDFKSDSAVALFAGGRNPMYVDAGYLLYAGFEGGLYAVRFDLATRRVEGAPVRVLERVGSNVAARGFDVSPNGLLVQHDAEGVVFGTNDQLVIVDPGKGVDTVRVPTGQFRYPRFSPDGRRIAIEVFATARAPQTDIYVADLVTGAYTQLTFDGDNDEPAWSPDGKRIAFDRVVSGSPGEVACVKLVDNSAPERCVPKTRSGEIMIQQWADDSTILYAAQVGSGLDDIFLVGTDSGSVPRPYVTTPFIEAGPRRSPDGSLVVFESNESGGYQLWMRDFPAPKGKWNISRTDARAARWTPDGRSVYFWRRGAPNDTLFRARIDRTPAIVVGAEEVVQVVNIDGLDNWDLHPDGRRYVMSIPAAVTAAAPGTKSVDRYLLLENWFRELTRLTASPAK
jgi:serine/threonine-protein kinase